MFLTGSIRHHKDKYSVKNKHPSQEKLEYFPCNLLAVRRVKI
jgi:hypothetical protein